MKKIIGSALLLLSLNSTAMTEEALGECIMNDLTAQMLFSMVQDEARAKNLKLEDYEIFVKKLLVEDVKTCRHIAGLSAEQLAKIYIATPDAKIK